MRSFSGAAAAAPRIPSNKPTVRGEDAMTTSSLQGKSVIVTGASKGIGKGIARVFAQAGGAKVLVVSRNLKEAEAAAKEFGNGASGFAADVTKPEDMAAMAKAANERYGGVDVLCANAGQFPQIKLEDMTA